ncbi:hypothetical protein WMY93_033816 [Mugilogobius chulae]|uniref:Uncharacterized protein n=1 Tax=Mugilogobius chulae TaxID=88201 RepID=A0AAW0MRP8_9GOBI
MLCCCLRSSVTVNGLQPRLPRRPGGGGAGTRRCPGDGVLPRLLLSKDVGVSEYLWTCHVTSLLRDRILESLIGRRKSRRRDIYTEMMDTPHTCPVATVTASHDTRGTGVLLRRPSCDWSSSRTLM